MTTSPPSGIEHPLASLRITRLVVGAAVGVVLTMGLTSCDPIPTDAPLAMSASQDGVAIAICGDNPIRDYYMQFRKTADAQWQTVFEAQGGPVEAVDTAHPDPSLSVSTTEPFELIGGSIVSALFADTAESSDVVYEAEFRIPEAGLAEHQWIKPDGSVVDDPCPS